MSQREREVDVRGAHIRRMVAWFMVCLLLAWPLDRLGGQTPGPWQGRSPQQIVTTMLANEDAAFLRREHWAYVAKERSDRTGGHLWTEKVVEIPGGKVRMLLEEDGAPLSADRRARERGRLAGIVADPAAFQRKELALRNDEAHAKRMLGVLPKAYLLSDVHEQGGFLRIDFRPDPGYSPQSIEERVLHGMSGYMLIEPRSLRLHHIEGRLAEEVSIGYGLLATIHAGSNFATTRDAVGSPAATEWKTTSFDTDVNGKAIFFKAIAKKEHAEHAQFVHVANDLTVAQAVEMVEQ